MHKQLKQIDTKEFELPETVFIRDIESRVFQALAMQCLAKIKGIAPLEGTLFDSLLGRDSADGVKGIYVEQDQKSHSVNVKVEVNVAYGISIPEKADEIQTRLAQEISSLTGLHVGCVHVVFKNLISSKESLEGMIERRSKKGAEASAASDHYDDQF